MSAEKNFKYSSEALTDGFPEREWVQKIKEAHFALCLNRVWILIYGGVRR